ncbi:hypothetical protein ANCCEY_13406 [Ancylostoma ceylanicum]|uniref:C-type lectin domain-containing protein n=1 Tax=Ancylostoma ceylanicum TaxID=53326 RepID=A0A0D6LIQ4_9BILA|nr:hypothetical protein ANCCEY_13406 [Ancylostoma ceylanicum]
MTYGYFWIGFSRQGPKWVWDDGSSSGYTNWAEGNNKGRKCAVMKVADGTWVTADCSRGYQAMCSGPALEEETTPKPTAPPPPCRKGFFFNEENNMCYTFYPLINTNANTAELHTQKFRRIWI